MSRTIESLQQVIVGLYPLSTRPPTYRADINIRNMTEESLLPNTFSCKRLRDLDKQFARAAALAWNDTLKPLDKKLSKYIDGKPIRIVSSLPSSFRVVFSPSYGTDAVFCWLPGREPSSVWNHGHGSSSREQWAQGAQRV